MNANDIIEGLAEANEIDEYGQFGRTVEALLRQQQAEIESMQERMIVAEKELNHMRSFFGCDPAYYGMTPAEPVAHRYKFEEGAWKYGDGYDATGAPNDPDYLHYEPLYTHPAKTLTDEEIDFFTKKYFNIHPEAELSEQFRIKLYELEEFVRAILKKASEK